MKSRQQDWASRALATMTERKKNPELLEKFKTLCMKTPALIHQSGLMQALAFLAAREGAAGKAFLEDLAQVYRGEKRDPNGTRLFEQVAAAPLAEYMALTRDVTDAASWLRRLAQSELRAEEDGP